MSMKFQEQAPIAWLSRWFHEHNPGLDFSLDEDFYASKLVDSFGFVTLLSEMEQAFAIKIEFDHLRLPQSKTIRGLASLIENQLENAQRS